MGRWWSPASPDRRLSGSRTNLESAAGCAGRPVGRRGLYIQLQLVRTHLLLGQTEQALGTIHGSTPQPHGWRTGLGPLTYLCLTPQPDVVSLRAHSMRSSSIGVRAGGLRDALADRYALERELGRGGMAAVYLAHDLRHDRPVALKVLLPELAATLGPERFQREIQLAARLQHPHILTVHDSGEAAGQLWFTMPFVEGETLRDRLRRERQLPVDDALRIATRGRAARSTTPTSTAWSTATSSPRTSCSPATAARWSPTSASPARSAADDGAHRDRDRDRDAGLHEPRAGGGRQDARRPDRHLLAGVGALRDAGRRAAVHRRRRRRRSIAKRLTEPAPSVRAVRPTRAGARGRGDPEGAGAGAGGPVRHRGAVRPGAARRRPSVTTAATTAAGRRSPRRARRHDARRRAAPSARPASRPSPSPLGFLIGVGVLFAWRHTGAAPSRRAARASSPCSPSRTWATRATPTSPTASATRCAASSAKVAGLEVIARGSSHEYRHTHQAAERDRPRAGRGLPADRDGALGEVAAARAACG